MEILQASSLQKKVAILDSVNFHGCPENVLQREGEFCSSPCAPILETIPTLLPVELTSVAVAPLAWTKRLHELFTLCVILIWSGQRPGIGRHDWGRSELPLGVDT